MNKVIPINWQKWLKEKGFKSIDRFGKRGEFAFTRIYKQFRKENRIILEIEFLLDEYNVCLTSIFLRVWIGYCCYGAMVESPRNVYTHIRKLSLGTGYVEEHLRPIKSKH